TLVTTDSDGYKGLSLIGLIPAIVGAIQEQQAQIQALALSVGQPVRQAGQSLVGVVGEKIEVAMGIFQRITTKWLEADHVRINDNLEMIDQVTGEIYCLSISNGEWLKSLGKCLEKNNPAPSGREAPLPVAPIEIETEPEVVATSTAPAIPEGNELVAEEVEIEPQITEETPAVIDESIVIEETSVVTPELEPIEFETTVESSEPAEGEN
ncbi:MAG: hypothetical protein COV08_01265, partial [Candidatus Vogelbacteria bacterium CG10_big_fil_rev_8_21_14_0_10_49_38]